MAGGVRVETTADGRFGTNSYLVMDTATKDAVVVDANFEPQQVIDAARSAGAEVRAILLTHTDIDHVAGLEALREAFGAVPIVVHEAERKVIEEGVPLRREFGATGPGLDNVVAFRDGARYQAGSLEFAVLHTPGHSPGGVSLLIAGMVFTGDALFAGSVGRSDFANSDGAALIAGIGSRLLSLPDETVVYSGHGPATTIGRERKTNPFL